MRRRHPSPRQPFTPFLGDTLPRPKNTTTPAPLSSTPTLATRLHELIQAIARQAISGKHNRVFVVVLVPVTQIPPELDKLFVCVDHDLPDHAPGLSFAIHHGKAARHRIFSPKRFNLRQRRTTSSCCGGCEIRSDAWSSDASSMHRPLRRSEKKCQPPKMGNLESSPDLVAGTNGHFAPPKGGVWGESLHLTGRMWSDSLNLRSSGRPVLWKA